jgi:hypothetical protein
MRRHLARLPLLQRALAWLLLALLPLAQAVAAGHAVSHLAGGGQGSPDDRQALHAAHCELCITAATVAGGALPATLPVLPPLELAQAAPVVAVADLWSPALVTVYDSRAPPAFTH